MVQIVEALKPQVEKYARSIEQWLGNSIQLYIYIALGSVILFFNFPMLRQLASIPRGI
jgi:hypothetical protein